MRRLGIDVGSRHLKIAGFDGERPLFTEMVDTVWFYRNCRLASGELDIAKLNIFNGSGHDPESFDSVIATGYGRYNISIKGAEVISEIRAHVNGAVFQTKLLDFTMIDLGGQDTKASKVEGGRVVDFTMNDKCAAGSGRYLENIANMLKVTPEELAAYREEPVELSATCAIFGESEVIGRLAEGVKMESICAGANLSVARRVATMLTRYKSKKYVITGGVARNKAVVEFIASRVDGEVVVPENPTFNGAIGSAINAQNFSHSTG